MTNVVDFVALLPLRTSTGREIVAENYQNKLILYVPRSGKWGGGRESKKITINRFAATSDLFFEGLGLWIGEGGKSKGLYFGNSCPELLQRFLNLVERELGLSKSDFKVTLNVPRFANEIMTKKKWSNILQIPAENFTAVCVDPRINKEYAQVYLNSIVLVELMNKLFRTIKPEVSTNEKFASAFLRGLFAAEGQVALKEWGTLFYVSFSSIEEDLIAFTKKCLKLLRISSGKYMPKSKKFPIYGYRNFKRFRELGIHALHPEKREKFERGFANYKRVNVLDGEEARALILEQLASSPKTYDELAAALGKARTTIQAHHIPILEREGKVKCVGKRGHASLWAPAEDKITPPLNVNRAPCAEPMSFLCKSHTILRQAWASSAP